MFEGSFCYDENDGCIRGGVPVYSRLWLTTCKKTNPNFEILPLCEINFETLRGEVSSLCSCPKKDDIKEISFENIGNTNQDYYNALQDYLLEGNVIFDLCSPGDTCFFGAKGCVPPAPSESSPSF